MDKLQKLFEHVIGLPLQQEGHGGELQTLEAVVHVLGGVLELGLKDKTALKAKPNPVRKIIRYPDVFTPNAKSTLRLSEEVCLLLHEYPHDQAELPNRHV